MLIGVISILSLSNNFSENFYLGVPILEKELAGFPLQFFLNRKGFTLQSLTRPFPWNGNFELKIFLFEETVFN